MNMKKIEITKSECGEIIEKFNNGISMRKLEKEYEYSFTFIQKLIKSSEWEIGIQKNYVIREGYSIIAICNLTKKEFRDYINESGAITKHITTLYPNEAKISKYIRKTIEYATGKFWYDKYFTFEYKENIVIDENNIKRCRYCDWYCDDFMNKSGAYEKHLLNNHGIVIEEHLENNPNDRSYFNHIPAMDALTCMICGKKLSIINHKHLIKHNISVEEYKIKYSENVVSKSSSAKLKISTTNLNKHHRISKTSKAENEIKKFLIDNNISIIQSSRKTLNGLEIDLFSPVLKIGIEYNGNLYHTELYGKKKYDYHLNKTKIAMENDVHLYHIHEDEWELHEDIIKNKLLHIFKKNMNTVIHARKCELKPVSSYEKKNFLNDNHIQGDDKSTIFIGAYYGDVLYALMAFNNNRYMNKDNFHNDSTYELTRFAIKSGFNISGIASRLLKYFINNYSPTKIISFADRRWTPSQHNNLYTNLGFTCTEILKPDYSYYKRSLHRSNRLHKFGFGKTSLKRRFPEIYDNNKTEWEMMQELGYDRIWDCGKFKYVLNI